MPIIRYEIMERPTRERLMFDMETLLKNDSRWRPVGGVAIIHRIERPDHIDRYLMSHTFLQALVQYDSPPD